jgi:hypothetical protein
MMMILSFKTNVVIPDAQLRIAGRALARTRNP